MDRRVTPSSTWAPLSKPQPSPLQKATLVALKILGGAAVCALIGGALYGGYHVFSLKGYPVWAFAGLGVIGAAACWVGVRMIAGSQGEAGQMPRNEQIESDPADSDIRQF
jgi:hypothetical protein